MGANRGREGEKAEEGEKEKREEKGRSLECPQAGTRVARAPRISASAHFHHLDGSDLHRTAGKGIDGAPLGQKEKEK